MNKIILFVFAVSVLGCNHKMSEKKNSYVHSVIDSLKMDKSKNILIYTINPNDCINCLIGFISLKNSLSTVTNSQLYVISIEREIEKKELMRSKNIDLTDSVNRSIVWDKNIFMKINGSVSLKKEISLSSLTIYNYQRDSIIYSKSIKEIISVDEFSAYLKEMIKN